MGLTAGLEAEAYDRSYSDVELVRRIAAYFRPHWRKVVLVAFMVSLVSLAATITPIVISASIDRLAGNPQLQLLLAAAAVVTVLGALGWAFNFVQQRYSARAVAEVVLALREDAFRAVMRRDLSFCYVGYPGFCYGRHPDDRSAQPVGAGRGHQWGDDKSEFAVGAHRPGPGTRGALHRLALSPPGAPGHAVSPTLHCLGQRQYPGDH
jgi:hypothetical protein